MDKVQKLAKPTPCRFHEDQLEALVKTGRRFRTKPAVLIRQAVDEALARWQQGAPIVINQRTTESTSR